MPAKGVAPWDGGPRSRPCALAAGTRSPGERRGGRGGGSDGAAGQGMSMRNEQRANPGALQTCGVCGRATRRGPGQWTHHDPNGDPREAWKSHEPLVDALVQVGRRVGQARVCPAAQDGLGDLVFQGPVRVQRADATLRVLGRGMQAKPARTGCRGGQRCRQPALRTTAEGERPRRRNSAAGETRAADTYRPAGLPSHGCPWRTSCSSRQRRSARPSSSGPCSRPSCSQWSQCAQWQPAWTHCRCLRKEPASLPAWEAWQRCGPRRQLRQPGPRPCAALQGPRGEPRHPRHHCRSQHRIGQVMETVRERGGGGAGA